jgi:hypothetical protein
MAPILTRFQIIQRQNTLLVILKRQVWAVLKTLLVRTCTIGEPLNKVTTVPKQGWQPSKTLHLVGLYLNTIFKKGRKDCSLNWDFRECLLGDHPNEKTKFVYCLMTRWLAGFSFVLRSQALDFEYRGALASSCLFLSNLIFVGSIMEL